MKSFSDELTDLIIQNETPRLNDIMREVSKKIQKDVIQKTKEVVDKYYQDYTQEKGRVYIRVDEYRMTPSKRRDKNGNRLVRKRDRNVSLRSVITKNWDSNQPAIGVCRPLDNILGWQSGVLFDEGYFQTHMKHSHKGKNFTEWDIVEDFLWGVHGNESVYTTEPSAGYELYRFIENYDVKKLFNDTVTKYK
jgi:hypothetical protein